MSNSATKNMSSILLSVKKMLGIDPTYTNFDMDLIMHINSVFVVLNQLGVGPTSGYAITDSTATWSSFLGTDNLLNMVKSYMFLKVRLLFDPPTSSAVMECYNKTISELEWRISITKSTPVEPNDSDDDDEE